MTAKNPTRIVEEFNNCINNQDVDGLANLMAENHIFIDRAGESRPKGEGK